MADYGLADAGPKAAGIGLIVLGLIFITGGVVLELLTRGGLAGVSFLILGPLFLGFGAYLVWVASTLQDGD